MVLNELMDRSQSISITDHESRITDHESRITNHAAPFSLFPIRNQTATLRAAMVLVIDNYDSFTYNLVQYLGELKVDLQVHRNDQISLDQVRALNPDRILVSPGPCSPNESGLSNDIIREFGQKIPVFGVCLGHQCIGHTFGAKVVVNYRMMHGKTSLIKHNGRDLFEGMPNPFAATRYHSLVIQRDTLPDFLEVTAETDEGEVMGIRHKQLPIWGVQFHPESILTESGRTIMKNFLKLSPGK